MPYGLMWTARDKAAIKAELDALRTLGHDGEIGRLMAYLASVASYGASAVSQNVHMHVGRQILHSACPFGTVGVFYAYDGPPTKDIYILAFCTKRLHVCRNSGSPHNKHPLKDFRRLKDISS